MQIPLHPPCGEGDAAADAEFVHLDDIRSRSERHGWAIAAHSHRGLFQVVMIEEGGAQLVLDDRRWPVAGPAAVLLPPAVPHGFEFVPGTRGRVLTAAESVLADGAAERDRLPILQDLFRKPTVVDLRQAPEVVARIVGLIGQLEAEFRWPLPGRGLMCDWLLRALLLLLHRQQALAAAPQGKDKGKEQARSQTFHRFRLLVEQNYRQHWPVARYAEALDTTESRLNRLCRDIAGKTAFELIQDRLLLEARRRLTYVATPVTALAYELGFQDPSYFCRFFRKHTGLSPARFREQGAAG